jgi:hypothetical protein
VQWDSGGSRWRRVGVKPCVRVGGVLGTFPGPYSYSGWPAWKAHGPGPSLHHPTTSTCEKATGEASRKRDHEPGRRRLPLPTSALNLPLFLLL